MLMDKLLYVEENYYQIKMEVPEDCPLKESVNVPVSCPCYNLSNCKVKQVE